LTERKRVRGVQASREKLEKAMLKNGLETQVQLSAKIAEIESLTKLPNNLVNKVFQEKPVTHYNLTRIANALNVEVHTLLPSSIDTLDIQTSEKVAQVNSPLEHLDTDTAEPTENNKAVSIFGLHIPSPLILAAFFISAFFIYLFLISQYADNNEEPLNNQLIHVSSNKPNSIVASLLVEQLINEGHPAKISAAVVSAQGVTSSALSNKAAMTISITETDLIRYTVFRVQSSGLSDVSEGRSGLGLIMSADIARKSADVIAKALSDKLIHDRFSEIIEIQTFNDPEAFYEYSRGIDELSNAHIEEHFVRANSHFSTAKTIDPSLTSAIAGQCQTSAMKSWLNDAKDMLESARSSCDLAVADAPETLSSNLALATLAIHSGETETGIAILKKMLSYADLRPEIYYWLAHGHYMLYQSDYLDERADAVLKWATKATDISRYQWRAYNRIGILNWQKGEIDKAIINFNNASTFDNQQILANLGVMQLCRNQVKESELTFSRLIDKDPSSYLAYEQLGTLAYLGGEFNDALAFKLTSLELNPNSNIHQIPASIADIYLSLNKPALAEEHYRKAIELVDADTESGVAGPSDLIHKHYYLTQIAIIKNDEVAIQGIETFLKQDTIREINIGTQAKAQLVFLHLNFGDKNLAETLRDEIFSICPVYKGLPYIAFDS
jgi:tetratricopeptide (TPR) repeat protein